MKHLFVNFLSTTESGFYVSFLDYCSIIVLLCGISVIVVKNPIGSLIALIAVYGMISVFLIFVGLTFIGFSYIIVYIGAVSILFLFILMLINVRTSELHTNNWNSIPLATSIVILLNFLLSGPKVINKFDDVRDMLKSSFKENSLYSNSISSWFNSESIEVMYVTSNNWDGNIAETSHISTLGNILYTSYNMWLFITGIILLLAMVGAIIITINRNN